MPKEVKYPEFGAAVRSHISGSGLTLDRIDEASRKSRRIRLTRTTLSSWQNGRSRPQSWAALESLLTLIAEQSGLPWDRKRWQGLYRGTTAEPSMPASPAAKAGPSHPLVRDADPVLLGVRQARKSAEHGPVPPYVERDADHEIDAALEAATAGGGLVLIRGDSTAGKSRAAFEAMSRALSDLPLLIPGRGIALDSCVEEARALSRRGRQCVVWLDDLEHYLGPSLLDQVVLRELVGLRAVLLATMRLSEYDRRAPRQTGTAKGDDAYARIDLSDPVLKAADIIDLRRRWSEAELARTETQTDPRLLEALRHHQRYGIAEYVSAGPPLWDRWHNARYLGGNPRGHALVATAVDLARSGLGPVSTELITSLHSGYLADEESAMLSPEPLEAAMAWACQDPLGASRLLMPAGQDLWRPFDYLVDTLSQLPDAPPVPDAVREAAVEHASSVQERYSVGVSCYRAERIDLALRAFLPSAETGHVDSMLYVGSIFLDQNREAEAETWWRRLAKAGNARGMLNLGVRSHRKGQRKKAEKWWRRAFEAGLPEAAPRLANVHEDRGEYEEAERLWRLALDAEVPDACFRFGLLAYQRNEHEEAERLYLEGARRGHRECTTNLAQVFLAREDYEEAEKLYLIAAEAGDCVAMRALGFLNEWRGRIHPGDEAPEERSRRIAESLRNLFHEAEREGKWNGAARSAKEWYQRAFDHGDLMSLRLLGNLYQRRARYGKAHKCYRRAAKLGDPVSAAWFNQPVLAHARKYHAPFDEEDERDETTPWRPSPRTLRVLEAALEIEADMAAEGLKELQDRPITTSDWVIGCFDVLPAQTWNQSLVWRQQMIRAFDDLAQDIREGRPPRPRSTGEEMALHLALERAAAITEDSPDLAEEFTEGLPGQPGDYDWFACKELLFEDHDVLMLYEPWMEGIENPENSVNQHMRMANLHPDDWFTPFRSQDARDPDRDSRY
ncbi:tetratricopeptide repeat protein [Streptomyces sp. NPDC001668]|uniref:tetratricopeptide repeat protein n=1 Tax=unclassified Streptomyces TaxID=2593676 RepID=UPI0036AA8508